MHDPDAILPSAQTLQQGEKEYSDFANPAALRDMLQLFLYICASNTDVEQPEDNRRTYRPKASGKIVDKYREIRTWNTGCYVGASLRRQRSDQPQGTSGGTGSRKRPHIRRGHWHHFWKGSGADKHLALHWIFPLVVNGDGDLPARVDDAK